MGKLLSVTPVADCPDDTPGELVVEAVAPEADGAIVEAPAPAQTPVVMKSRTLLRDTFMRVWRCGQQMGPEGIGLVLVCPECHSMIQLGLQGAQVTELKCACTIWSIRAIHI